MNKGVILWDIDGTLLSVKRPNNVNLHKALLETYGFSPIEKTFETQGKTDWEIISLLLNECNRPIEFQQTMKLLEQLDSLSSELDSNSIFLPLDGVKDFFSHFSLPFWSFGVVTGNTFNRAVKKLSEIKLLDFFNPNYFFTCEMNENRYDIVSKSVFFLKSQNIKTILIIGDTPTDITVAKECFLPVVGIASGEYSAMELELFNPNLLLENLKTPSQKILMDYLKQLELT
jgi:hypothetical protein